MAKTSQKKLGEILVEWGTLKPAEVDKGLAHAKAKGLRLGEALVDLKAATEAQVYKALAQQQGVEYHDLDKAGIPPNAVNLIPDDLMKRHLILPLGMEGGKLKVAVSDMDFEMLDVLQFRLGKTVKPVYATRGRIKALLDEMFNANSRSTIDQTIDRTIDRMKGSVDNSMDRSLDRSIDKGGASIDKTGASIDKTGRTIDKSVDEDRIGGDGDNAAQAPVIKLVNAMIARAVRERASDIHVEPMKDRVRVRYRIDGECVEIDRVQSRMRGPLIARLKIMAGIDIAEKRLPQDGRIKMHIDKQQIDFRVSSLPGVHGESMVLRILRPDNVRIGITNLGFEEEDNRVFQKIIRRPNGIFLVTGPTGSGKTTTLYAALNDLNRPDRKIITAEDPVEYNFPGINQCQVKEIIGLNFSKILRAMLRQAPNIILVGEIRDKEVAEVAIQAALTGHLVFSTLHTNDAPGAITRLIDMGVKPFLVASSIQAVLGQRLIRALCPKCKVIDKEPDPHWLRVAGITDRDIVGKTVYKARGCDHCTGTGFRGRIGIFEMMTMNNQLRTMAFERSPTNKIRQAAVATGMKTLLMDGKLKVLDGKTTAEEVIKVAQIEAAAM